MFSSWVSMWFAQQLWQWRDDLLTFCAVIHFFDEAQPNTCGSLLLVLLIWLPMAWFPRLRHLSSLLLFALGFCCWRWRCRWLSPLEVMAYRHVPLLALLRGESHRGLKLWSKSSWSRIWWWFGSVRSSTFRWRALIWYLVYILNFELFLHVQVVLMFGICFDQYYVEFVPIDAVSSMQRNVYYEYSSLKLNYH